MFEKQRNIKVLDYMIQHTKEEPYRGALIAAYNRLLSDVTSYESAIRKPSDWPYCSKCGEPYCAYATDNDYVHMLAPNCDCGAEVQFRTGRPEGMWNEV